MLDLTTYLSQSRWTYDILGHNTRQARMANASSTAVADTAVDRVTDMTHDPMGRVLTETTWSGSPAVPRTTFYTHDEVGRVTLTIDPGGNTDASTAFGRGTQVTARTLTDSIGARNFTYVFDDLGRLTFETEQAGTPGDATTQYGYDAASRQVEVTDAEGMVTQTVYSGLDQIAKISQDSGGLGQVVVKTYTQLGNLHTETAYDGPNQTGNAQVTTYGHDKQGRRLSVTLPDTHSWQYLLDDAGLVKQRTDARGMVTDYTRNWRGQVLTATVAGQQEEYYEYDELGRRTLARRDADNQVSFEYDDLGNLTSETQMVFGISKVLSYPSYTQAGKRETVLYPADTGISLTYAYDGLDNVEAIFRNGSTIVAYEYAGRAWTSRNVNVGLSLETLADRDGLGRRIYGIEYAWSRDNIRETFTYVRDRVSNPTSVERIEHSWLADGLATYAYDGLHRVRDADYTGLGFGQPTSEDINLDALGNRVSYTGRTGPEITYTHNLINAYTALDPQTTAPQYDANGNLTRNDRGWRFEYDYENRLVAIRAPNNTQVAAFTYDALGRCTSDVSGTPEYTWGLLYFYDRQSLVAEYVYWQEEESDHWLWGYHVNGGTYIDERVYSSAYDVVYALDAMYNVVRVFDYPRAGYTYDVYGQMRDCWEPSMRPRFGFQGRPLMTYTAGGQTLVLYDFRARVYDPILGRFMQRDPADYIDSYNLYLAFGGNPLVWMDPTGESLMDLLGSTTMRTSLFSAMAGAVMKSQGLFRSVAEALNFRSQMITGLMNTAGRMGTQRGADFLNRANQILQGTTGRVFTANSYRAGYEWLMGQDVQAGTRLHHVFPQKFVEWFASKGINAHVPFFLTEIEAGQHARMSAAYNAAWQTWIAANPNATVDQIFAQAQRFMKMMH